MVRIGTAIAVVAWLLAGLSAQARDGAFFLHTDVEGPGRIAGPADGWQAAGSAITLEAVPGPHARFIRWSGDVPDGLTETNPLVLRLDHSRAFTAHFVQDAPVRHVSPQGTHQFPFASWATAATNIQAAIDAAEAGDVVLVGDGRYDSGATDAGPGPARVAVTQAVTVVSVNGPASTWIVGQGPVGEGAVRGVYLSSNAVFSGFTVTNGHTRGEGYVRGMMRGGGIYCEDGAVVSNCWIVGNAARRSGGGVQQGRVLDSVISNNGAEEGGGAARATLDGCVVAVNWATVRAGGLADCRAARTTVRGNVAADDGGVSGGSVTACVIRDNRALVDGGGVGGADVFESVIVSNMAGARGGGVGLWSGSEARNCVVVGNRAQAGGGIYLGEASLVSSCTVVGNEAVTGGGVLDARGGSLVANSIVTDNAGAEGANWHMPHGAGNWFFTCAQPAAPGWGNFADAPGFADAAGLNYRLRLSSPCIDAGTNQAWMAEATDLAGRARVFGGVVDLGAYELAAYWLQTVAGRGGRVEPAPGYQRAGAAVTVTAIPAAGYEFAGWSGDVDAASAAVNPLHVVMDGARRVVASFRMLPAAEAAALEAAATAPMETEAPAEAVVEEPLVFGAAPVVVEGAVMVGEALPPGATTADSDGDGMTDADERRAGTDPLDANDVLGIGSIEAMAAYAEARASGGTNGYVIAWSSKNGALYSVEYATNLATGFEVLASNIVGTAPLQSIVDPVSDDERRYYRIRLE